MTRLLPLSVFLSVTGILSVIGVERASAGDEKGSDAQVAAGQALYASGCASCHGAKLEGGSGPALSPLGTLKAIGKKAPTASDLAHYIRLNMPVDDPGSLSEAQGYSITAFILVQNGHVDTQPLNATNAPKLLAQRGKN